MKQQPSRYQQKAAQTRRAATLAALFAVSLLGTATPPFVSAQGEEKQNPEKRHKFSRDRDKEKEPDGPQGLLRRMVRAEMSRAFVARETTFFANGGAGTEQIVKRHPKRGMRRESIRPAGDLLVDNFKRSWSYSAQERRFVERESFLRRMQGRGRDMMSPRMGKDGLRVEKVGQEIVVGREADIVSVMPPEGVSAPSHRFWIDRETGLRLKTEERDARGRVLSGSYYLSLDLSPRFSDSDFEKPVVAADIPLVVEEKRRFPTADAARKAGFTFRAPTFLPPGFVLRDVEVVGKGERITQRFGNGMSLLSLVQTRGPLPFPAGEAMKMAKSGFIPFPRGQRAYVRREKDMVILLIGGLPDDELKRIGDSVR